MRRIAKTAAVACFALGFVWQYGGWIVEWVGRMLGLRGLTTTYADFVNSYVTTFMAEGSVLRVLAPWLIMAVGLIALVVLHRKA